ncbi:MAG: glutamyl-tRNA reductase, partial [Thermoguttaceae bacterium]
MNLRVIGVNHHNTAIAVRECLAFNSEQVKRLLLEFQDSTAEIEAVLLSTCNRTEFYVASESVELPKTEQIVSFLLKQKNLSFDGLPLASQFFVIEQDAAILHLFEVTSGLDSMVLGEAQIIGQVRAAYQLALDTESAGPLTHALFQSALKTAKDVATSTDLHRHRVSIPSVAIID